MSLSTMNSQLTAEFLLTPGVEGQYFDRKSASISAIKLAELVVGLANADGGSIAIGIRDRQFEGINSQGAVKINDFLQCGVDHCRPPVLFQSEFAEIVKSDGSPDRILFLHVDSDKNRVHETNAGDVFLRVGDETKKLRFDQRQDLEYDRGSRLYEDDLVDACTLDDLDSAVFGEYKKAVGYDGADPARLLLARGFARNEAGVLKLTVAGVLLFTVNPTRFLPSARLRFLRYEGIRAEVGTAMNIVKQEYIEGPLVKLLNRTLDVVGAQLRDFTALHPLEGIFVTAAEYPKFAWQEGVVNAVTHRAYNIHGDDIRVEMYDDRLLIRSPGKFPKMVDKNNIRESRYSRNPRIARALTEIGWVRELGEGVKRIYQEMEKAYLPPPVYEESGQTVLLTLLNNMDLRRKKRSARFNAKISSAWRDLNAEQHVAVQMALSVEKLTTKDYAAAIGRSKNYAVKLLSQLEEIGLLQKHARAARDPNQYYTLIEGGGE